jgi:hypothetical protein
MSDKLESALIIQLTEPLKWGAALPAPEIVTGRLTQVDPGLPFDVVEYTKRDREFQHRDNIIGAAICKVALHARTVWSGTVVYPRLQGVTRVTDYTGTNIFLGLDPQELGTLPVSNTAVVYVGNADIPYDAIRITDKCLYARDSLCYETLARAAAIFPDKPISENDPTGALVGATSIWATANGTDTSVLPNSAKALDVSLFKEPDMYLAERDNQIAAYVARVAQALKNPFEFASRIYVEIVGPAERESETYVLTETIFKYGTIYATGEEVKYTNPITDSGADTATLAAGAVALSTTGYLFGDGNDVGRTIKLDTSGLIYTITNYIDTTHCTVTPADTSAADTFVISNTIAKWWRANYTTGDVPGSAAWTLIAGPNLRQFLADPALSSRNRIVYNVAAKTLQWFVERLDTVHVPQIVGFVIPGVLPGQTLETVPLVPENKDSQFWRQKSGRVSLMSGTWASQYNIYPTAGNLTTALGSDPLVPTLFQSAKAVTLMMPSSVVAAFPTTCSAGTWAMNALVKPASTIFIAGFDRILGGTGVVSNLGVNFSAIGDTIQYQLPLPAGVWQLRIEYTNDLTASSDSLGFGVIVSLPNQTLLGDATPLYFTDAFGNALPKGQLATSIPIDINTVGQSYTFSIQWTAGSGKLHIRRLIFTSVTNATSHYIMEASWANAIPPLNYVAKLDVIGQRDTPDVMPFRFYVSAVSANPQITLTWKQARGAAWTNTQKYYPGDQVLYSGIYYEAQAIINPGIQPGGTNDWLVLSREPQIPLVIEQLQLAKLETTVVTPLANDNLGFRQDMVERALRADQDAYRASITSVGSNFPEFRVPNTTGYAWERSSTESWMAFQESYNPRLREMQIVSGGIVGGRLYEVRGSGGVVTYNSTAYSPMQRFYGVAGVTTCTFGGSTELWQVGAYRQSLAGDVGQPAYVPSGLEFILSAGTVAGWYASYASYPSIQVLQPWMIEKGIYVAQPEFWSPPTM